MSKDSLRDKRDEQLTRLRREMERTVEAVRVRLGHTLRIQFERSVSMLQDNFALAEEKARQEFEEGMAWAEGIENPVLRDNYEKSLQHMLELTLKFHKKLIDDFIAEWSGAS